MREEKYMLYVNNKTVKGFLSTVKVGQSFHLTKI